VATAEFAPRAGSSAHVETDDNEASRRGLGKWATYAMKTTPQWEVPTSEVTLARGAPRISSGAASGENRRAG